MPRPLILPAQRNDWCTPPEICSLVYSFFGGIPVLDPCGAQGQALKATRILHVPEDDGLAYDWRGNVFCNPPYGKGVDRWIRKAGDSVPRASSLVLVPAAVSSNYWHELVFPVAVAICFFRGRITFVGGDHGAGFASAMLFYGDSDLRSRFRQVFSAAGYVV